MKKDCLLKVHLSRMAKNSHFYPDCCCAIYKMCEFVAVIPWKKKIMLLPFLISILILHQTSNLLLFSTIVSLVK